MEVLRSDTPFEKYQFIFLRLTSFLSPTKQQARRLKYFDDFLLKWLISNYEVIHCADQR